MRPLPRILGISLLLAAAGPALTGCSSLHKSASGSFASVQISGHTPEQIRGATVLEFEQEGYLAADVKSPQMVFEKEGTKWDQVVHGNWMTENIWVRVHASVVPVSSNSWRLQCQAFRVRDKGEPLEAEPVPLRNSQSGPYQALLNKIAARLAR